MRSDRSDMQCRAYCATMQHGTRGQCQGQAFGVALSIPDSSMQSLRDGPCPFDLPGQCAGLPYPLIGKVQFRWKKTHRGPKPCQHHRRFYGQQQFRSRQTRNRAQLTMIEDKQARRQLESASATVSSIRSGGQGFAKATLVGKRACISSWDAWPL